MADTVEQDKQKKAKDQAAAKALTGGVNAVVGGKTYDSGNTQFGATPSQGDRNSYANRFSSGLLNVTAEEYANINAHGNDSFTTEHTKSSGLFNQNTQKFSQTYKAYPSLDAAEASIIGAPEQKRRSEYYKSIATATNNGVAKSTAKVNNPANTGSILSPKSGKNLLGL